MNVFLFLIWFWPVSASTCPCSFTIPVIPAIEVHAIYYMNVEFPNCEKQEDNKLEVTLTNAENPDDVMITKYRCHFGQWIYTGTENKP